jgi:hypothetical protein
MMIIFCRDFAEPTGTQPAGKKNPTQRPKKCDFKDMGKA